MDNLPRKSGLAVPVAGGNPGSELRAHSVPALRRFYRRRDRSEGEGYYIT